MHQLNDTGAVPTQGRAILLFSAPWCLPCKATKPSLDKLSTPTYEINGEDNPGLMRRFGVKTFPTLILLDAGDIVSAKYGGQTLAQLRAWVGE
ncbi:thioredoxin family protein [Deinococcus kurensis]|uniref:thioredoxin family protein n=1 Tax=Deinococcus kurensis TaxID=2662757 RepID=UPI0012D3433B|nr:thioredoxin family protein [Deinococcus kurensis]